MTVAEQVARIDRAIEQAEELINRLKEVKSALNADIVAAADKKVDEAPAS